MSNMSYCRFENTFKDLDDCVMNFNDGTSESEQKYRQYLIKLCVDIALDYGYEVGRDIVEE